MYWNMDTRGFGGFFGYFFGGAVSASGQMMAVI